jgi:hypothetical protein
VEQQKPQLMPILCENCGMYTFKDSIKCDFHGTSLFNQRLKFEAQLRVACGNDPKEWIFFTAKSSLYKKLPIMLQGNEMKGQLF